MNLRTRAALPLLTVLLLAAAVLLGGCNTIKGIGKDLQKAGEELEESADKND